MGVPNNVTPRLLRFAVGTCALLLIVSIASNAEQFTSSDVPSSGPRSVPPIERSLGEASETTEIAEEPIEIPQSVAVPLAVVLGAIGLYLLSKQRFSIRLRRPSMRISRRPAVVVSEEDEAEAIADFARDLIDELNEGDSPRYAIQRAYAAVETGFGAQELARKPAETPLRYLDRIFGRHGSVEEPLAVLTTLFQQARFSSEPVDEPMRGRAIEALTEIRDYYQTYSRKKIGNGRSRSATAKS